MLLFCERTKGGVHGNPPDLVNLVEGDLRHQIDFRQVYAAALENRLDMKREVVLGRKSDKVAVV